MVIVERFKWWNNRSIIKRCIEILAQSKKILAEMVKISVSAPSDGLSTLSEQSEVCNYLSNRHGNIAT